MFVNGSDNWHCRRDNYFLPSETPISTVEIKSPVGNATNEAYPKKNQMKTLQRNGKFI